MMATESKAPVAILSVNYDTKRFTVLFTEL